MEITLELAEELILTWDGNEPAPVHRLVRLAREYPFFTLFELPEKEYDNYFVFAPDSETAAKIVNFYYENMEMAFEYGMANTLIVSDTNFIPFIQG